MEFRMLGPLEVLHEGHTLALGGSKQRALLGVLLLHANEVVSVDRLVDELWGERPPGSAAKLVQGYVSGLRRVLGAGTDGSGPLATQAPGYALRLRPDELDLLAFERLAAEARAEDGPAAAERLRAALALWRGPALADLSFEGAGRQEAARLNDRRLAVLMERIELDLELGRHADLVGELEALAVQHPYQERLRVQLMLALYRSGRQADALRVYQETRRTLVDELGLEPGQELQQLERGILAHDPALDAPAQEPERAARAEAVAPEPAAPAQDDRRPVRKLVTVVFTDVVEWSSLAERLDAESLHQVQARYHDEAASVLERHGGTVEKFIGDAAVAVFGVPVVHEDDALRAVRAAAEVREAVAELNHELERDWGLSLTVHTGVNTGEVVSAPAGPGRALAAGDAMVVAARLQQAAPPGEILLGPDTYRLVRDAVRAERLEALRLKGREAPVAAWRLVEVAGRAPALSGTTFAPLVGRVRELGVLQDALARAVSGRSCELCTVLGPPGIGKSRLGRELAASVDDALILVGRCLPYGEGITFWPLAEIVRQVAGPDDPRTRIAELLRGDERAALIAERIVGALGLVESAGPSEETFWAVRRFFEHLARALPLIVAFDDLHWAEPTLLDLLEYLVGFSSDAPILILCLARPELLEQRPAWATPRPGATLIALEPLSDGEARDLVRHLPTPEALPERTLAQVVGAAEGNPLFLEQLHAFQVEPGATAQPIPPSIHALLAARIDRLDPDERIVLERASIEGRTFHLAALAALLPERLAGRLESILLALVRREFVQSARAGLPGEEAFRFRHILIRDAAYGALPKQARSELHERFAGWLGRRVGGGAGEYDEIVGYHLEQAVRLRTELGAPEPLFREVARRAVELLSTAARRALARDDPTAAAALFGRVAVLVGSDALALASVSTDLGVALAQAGDLERADAALARGQELARAHGDEGTEWAAAVERESLAMNLDPAGRAERARAIADEAIAAFARTQDSRRLARGWRLLAQASSMEGQAAAMRAALEEALPHARRGGDEREEAEIRAGLAYSLVLGPEPVETALPLVGEHLAWARAAGHGATEARLLATAGHLEAMGGRLDAADTLLARADELARELGAFAATIQAVWTAGEVALLAGDAATAEPKLRETYELLEAAGDRGYLSTAAAMLAVALAELGRAAEAEELVETSRASAAPDDLVSQLQWRRAAVRTLRARSELERAEEVAREAVGIAAGTDFLAMQADAVADHGDVLRVLGHADEADATLARALALSARKGIASAPGRVGPLAGATRAEDPRR